MIQKWRKIATFLILTFELCEGIKNPTKNRPKMSGCKSWLRGMDLFRFASLAADFCATRKPALSNRLILALNHLYSVVQIQHNTHI